MKQFFFFDKQLFQFVVVPIIFEGVLCNRHKREGFIQNYIKFLFKQVVSSIYVLRLHYLRKINILQFLLKFCLVELRERSSFWFICVFSKDVHFRIVKYSRIIPNLFYRIQNFESLTKSQIYKTVVSAISISVQHATAPLLQNKKKKKSTICFIFNELIASPRITAP